MAFSRKFLTALGVEADKIEEIITAHTEVTSALKAQIEDTKADTEELTKVKEQLEQAKKNLKETKDQLTAAEKDRDKYKGESETATADLEKLRNETATKETAAKRDSNLKSKLKELKYSEDAIDDILDSRKDYASRIEFDDKGNASNIDDVIKAIQSDKPKLTPIVETRGTNPATPPANTGGKVAMTKDDIMKIQNTAERQKKIAENPELFGIAKT